MKTIFPKIIVENGALKKTAQLVKPFGAQFTIITDVHLKKLGGELMASMRKSGLKTHMLIVPASEQTKSLSFVGKIAKSLLKLGMKRDSCILALGGGVVGDLAGFMASVYMRGISYVALPTTLLAMGDSSIGGKTGVDLEEGKNLIGAFYHPKLIIMDPAVLRNVPNRAFRCGLAEIVKHAVIADKNLFSFMKKNAAAIQERKPAALKKIIQASIRIKMKIVKADERESITKRHDSVSRMMVNYGHTVGHALEKLSAYTLPHGEAVAIGMVAENRLAVGKKLLKEKDALKITALLKQFGLPTALPPQYSKQALENAMQLDKKNIGGHIYFALPTAIGKVRILKI